MKTYKREPGSSHAHLFCGHWNGSPVEIGLQSEVLREIPESETHHFHNYHEYYVVLEGRAELNVEGKSVKLEPGNVVMIEPGESHSVTWIDPAEGCLWVIIKEKSQANSKHAATGPS